MLHQSYSNSSLVTMSCHDTFWYVNATFCRNTHGLKFPVDGLQVS